MIITIDGPAGSGKSTAARQLAVRLQIPYLDTGAMYRAIAYTALQRGIDPDDGNAMLELARSVRLDVECEPIRTRVRVDDQDVTEDIRTMPVTAGTRAVAGHPGIRKILVERQREIARALGSLVTEGRDQGTVVFPDADAKFVLDASLQRRAERRLQEMVADGESVSFAEVVNNMLLRDRADCGQWESLLVRGDVKVIDTTGLSISEVVNSVADSVASVMLKKSSCLQSDSSSQ